MPEQDFRRRSCNADGTPNSNLPLTTARVTIEEAEVAVARH